MSKNNYKKHHNHQIYKQNKSHDKQSMFNRQASFIIKQSNGGYQPHQSLQPTLKKIEQSQYQQQQLKRLSKQFAGYGSFIYRFALPLLILIDIANRCAKEFKCDLNKDDIHVLTQRELDNQIAKHDRELIYTPFFQDKTPLIPFMALALHHTEKAGTWLLNLMFSKDNMLDRYILANHLDKYANQSPEKCEQTKRVLNTFPIYAGPMEYNNSYFECRTNTLMVSSKLFEKDHRAISNDINWLLNAVDKRFNELNDKSCPLPRTPYLRTKKQIIKYAQELLKDLKTNFELIELLESKDNINVNETNQVLRELAAKPRKRIYHEYYMHEDEYQFNKRLNPHSDINSRLLLGRKEKVYSRAHYVNIKTEEFNIKNDMHQGIYWVEDKISGIPSVVHHMLDSFIYGDTNDDYNLISSFATNYQSFLQEMQFGLFLNPHRFERSLRNLSQLQTHYLHGAYRTQHGLESFLKDLISTYRNLEAMQKSLGRDFSELNHWEQLKCFKDIESWNATIEQVIKPLLNDIAIHALKRIDASMFLISEDIRKILLPHVEAYRDSFKRFSKIKSMRPRTQGLFQHVLEMLNVYIALAGKANLQGFNELTSFALIYRFQLAVITLFSISFVLKKYPQWRLVNKAFDRLIGPARAFESKQEITENKPPIKQSKKKNKPLKLSNNRDSIWAVRETANDPQHNFYKSFRANEQLSHFGLTKKDNTVIITMHVIQLGGVSLDELYSGLKTADTDNSISKNKKNITIYFSDSSKAINLNDCLRRTNNVMKNKK